MNQAPPPPPPAQVMPPGQKKDGMSTGCTVVLIVGLVIAVGITVLAALVFLGVAGGKKVIEKARVLQTKAAMQSLDIAIKGFQTEYGRLPMTPEPAPTRDGDAYDTSAEEGRMLIDVLLAQDQKENPRGVRFWEPPPTKNTGVVYTTRGGLTDSWGTNGFRILLDDNRDGLIADPEKVRGDISGSVLIYSAGPDGDFLTWKDNVRSWK